MSRPLQLCAIILIGGAAGCSRPAAMMGPSASTQALSPEIAVDAANPLEARVLIRKAALGLEVEKVGSAIAAATALTTRLGGYVESSVQHSDRSARLVLRVPSTSLDASLDSLARIGKVESRSITSTDVTEQARDLDARVATLRATRDRLRQLLERAASVSDIAAVETQLARVQQDLESLEGRLKSLRTDVALSELSLSIEQRHVLGPLGLVAAGLAWVVEKLFILR
jgi:hypothetical protein